MGLQIMLTMEFWLLSFFIKSKTLIKTLLLTYIVKACEYYKVRTLIIFMSLNTKTYFTIQWF